MKFKQETRHGDVTGGFNSPSLERSMEHARNAFLSCITLLQDGGDPKPYLITSYALTLIGNYQIRDAIVNEFEDSLDSLEDGRYSPAGIRECIAVWASISEYMGMFGADKRITVMGESSDYVEPHFDEGGDLPLSDEKKDDNGDNDEDDDDNGFGGSYLKDYKRKNEKEEEKDKTEEFESFEPQMEVEHDESEDDEIRVRNTDIDEVVEFSEDEDEEIVL